MVSVCVGDGTASAKPGVPQVVAFAGAALASRLNNRGGAWANWVAPFIGVISFETDNFCSLGPPAMPTITLDDVLAVLNPASIGNFDAIQKFRDVIFNILWYDLCQCDAGTQPTAPAVPAAPPGSPDPSGVLSNTGPSLACAAQENTVHSWTNISIALVMDSDDGDHRNSVFFAPPGATSVRVRSMVTTAGAGPHVTGYTVTLTSYYPPGSPVSQSSVTHTPVGVEYVDDFTLSTPNPQGWTLKFNATNTAANSTDTAYARVEVYCGTTPGGTQIACCPTDQYTTGLLISILQAITLIQRQHVPFAYVPGASHSVSGSGEVAVSGILGLLIELDSIPSRAGVLEGTPETVYSVGWVNVGTADGWTKKHVIEHSPMLILDVPPSTTRVGYSLPGDVSGDITELVREP